MKTSLKSTFVAALTGGTRALAGRGGLWSLIPKRDSKVVFPAFAKMTETRSWKRSKRGVAKPCLSRRMSLTTRESE